MKKLGKFLTPGVTLGLFLLAGALLLVGSIGGTRAALEYQSNEYTAEIVLDDIGVTLLENGRDVAHRDYQYDTNASGERVGTGDWADTNTGILVGDAWKEENGITETTPFRPGVIYREEISAENSGTIDEYVRITIYKYWEKDGKKDPTLDPDLIKLEWANQDHWTIDKASSTDERTVLYYNDLLPGIGKNSDGAVTKHRTEPCTATLTIDGKVATKVSETRDGGSVQYTYDYNGAKFILKATVDAVQDHNATEAKIAAWGTTG